MSDLTFTLLTTAALGLVARSLYRVGHHFGRVDGRKEMRREAVDTVERLYAYERDTYEALPDYQRAPSSQHRVRLGGIAAASLQVALLRSPVEAEEPFWRKLERGWTWLREQVQRGEECPPYYDPGHTKRRESPRTLPPANSRDFPYAGEW